MDLNLAIICGLTFVIHLIGTLAYSARIAGVRTGRIAVSFALFNVLALVSRTSNSVLAPFVSKRVETALTEGPSQHSMVDFRWMLAATSLATVAGALLTPSLQRIFTKAVVHFQVHRSIPRLLLHTFLRGGLAQVKDCLIVPRAGHVAQLRAGPGISARIIVLNVAAVALWTVGVFAAIYSASLSFELRMTASNLSGVVNGLATVLMLIIIDPHLSVMTDDVMEGKMSETAFRQAIVWLIGSRLLGTILAQALLVPAASVISLVAKFIPR
jgi:hypothetical protein